MRRTIASASGTPQPGALEAGERLTYRVAEVSDLTGLSPSSIHDLIRRGVLDAIRLGPEGVCTLKNGIRRRRRAIVLIPADELDRLLLENRVSRLVRVPAVSCPASPKRAPQRGPIVKPVSRRREEPGYGRSQSPDV